MRNATPIIEKCYYYASIMLVAHMELLCSKLCRQNILRPNNCPLYTIRITYRVDYNRCGSLSVLHTLLRNSVDFVHTHALLDQAIGTCSSRFGNKSTWLRSILTAHVSPSKLGSLLLLFHRQGQTCMGSFTLLSNSLLHLRGFCTWMVCNVFCASQLLQVS